MAGAGRAHCRSATQNSRMDGVIAAVLLRAWPTARCRGTGRHRQDVAARVGERSLRRRRDAGPQRPRERARARLRVRRGAPAARACAHAADAERAGALVRRRGGSPRRCWTRASGGDDRGGGALPPAPWSLLAAREPRARRAGCGAGRRRPVGRRASRRLPAAPRDALGARPGPTGRSVSRSTTPESPVCSPIPRRACCGPRRCRSAPCRHGSRTLRPTGRREFAAAVTGRPPAIRS